MMQMMRTVLVSRVYRGAQAGQLTNDTQGVPLPSAGVAGAGNGATKLGVGFLHVVVGLLGGLVDLRNRRLLLVDQLRDFLVQLTKLDHILLNLADGSGSLQSSLAGIVGLARTGTGDLERKQR